MDDIIGTPKANMNRLGSSLQVKNTKLFLKAKDYIFLPFNTPVTLETTVKQSDLATSPLEFCSAFLGTDSWNLMQTKVSFEV